MKTFGLLLATALVASPALARHDDHPHATARAAQNAAMRSADRLAWTDLRQGRNSFTERQARARFARAGYTRVTGLHLDPQGLWQARGLRHGHRVSMALDYKGNLAER